MVCLNPPRRLLRAVWESDLQQSLKAGVLLAQKAVKVVPLVVAEAPLTTKRANKQPRRVMRSSLEMAGDLVTKSPLTWRWTSSLKSKSCPTKVLPSWWSTFNLQPVSQWQSWKMSESKFASTTSIKRCSVAFLSWLKKSCSMSYPRKDKKLLRKSKQLDVEFSANWQIKKFLLKLDIT